MSKSRKYAFTSYAMAASLEDTPVRYEDLAEIEKEFDDVETEISEFWRFCTLLCAAASSFWY